MRKNVGIKYSKSIPWGVVFACPIRGANTNQAQSLTGLVQVSILCIILRCERLPCDGLVFPDTKGVIAPGR